jgi:hypothetical protein
VSLLAGAVAAAGVVVVVVVVAGAGALLACTSISDASTGWLLSEGAGADGVGCVVVLVEAVEVTCAALAGVESGAGELSCAWVTDIAQSNAAAPQTIWLRRVDIG